MKDIHAVYNCDFCQLVDESDLEYGKTILKLISFFFMDAPFSS